MFFAHYLILNPKSELCRIYSSQPVKKLSQHMPIYLGILKILFGIGKRLSGTFIVCGDDMSLSTNKVLEKKR
jgi:hypothetical protein